MKNSTKAVLLGMFLLTGSLKAQTYSAEQYYAAGNQCYQNHQYAQGITYLNAALQLNPAYGDAYQLEGNCYYSAGDKASALACYNKAAVLEPNNVALAQMIASMPGQPNVQVQVNFGSSSSTTSTTTSSSTSLPPVLMAQPAAPAASDDADESEDSKYFDKAKSRLVKIHGSQKKAFLFDTTEAHTLDHVLLCDNVTDVEFITDAEGKAWRINLTQGDGGQKTYDENGHLLTSIPGH